MREREPEAEAETTTEAHTEAYRDAYFVMQVRLGPQQLRERVCTQLEVVEVVPARECVCLGVSVGYYNRRRLPWPTGMDNSGGGGGSWGGELGEAGRSGRTSVAGCCSPPAPPAASRGTCRRAFAPSVGHPQSERHQ